MSDVMNVNNRGIVTVSVAMAAVAVGAYYLYSRGSASASARYSGEPLSLELTIKIMSEIAVEVQKIAISLSKKEESLRKETMMAGQKVNEDGLRDLLVGEIHKGVELAESQIYAKYDVVQAQVEAGCKNHQSNAAVAKACQDITAILSIGSEPEAAPLPDDFTLEKAIAVMEDLMEGMSIALEECSAIVRAQLGNDLRTKEASAAINQLYVQRYPLVEGAVHKKHKCNKSTIEAALMKYQMEPAFNMKMQELSTKQKQRMQACGVSLGQ